MKPPVVVIARHCKTNQCWIAVRFKKIPSVAKISQSAPRERADAGERVPLAARGECLCSAYMRAPLSKVLSLTLAVGFALATGETAWAIPKTHRVLSRARRASCPRAAGQPRRRPRHQLPARVSTQCRPGQQPHQSRLLGAHLREQLIA